MSTPAELYVSACDVFDAHVHRIGGSWGNPTPCDEWTVRDLVNHVTVEDLWLPPLLAGKTINEVGDAFAGDQLGDEPTTTWHGVYQAARMAASEPDVETRTVDLSVGPSSAGEYLMQMFADHLIHSWDLAVATGASTELPPELVSACATWFSGNEEMWRSMGVIAERVDVPDGAGEQTRLLAAFGRSA